MSELPKGSSTGIGSLPGTDPHEAARLVLGELTWPHLPELPDRGVGAEMIGRGVATLVNLPFQRWGSYWQVADGPGTDLSRARDFLERDMDAFGEVGSDYSGPLRVTMVGPWTLASQLWRRSGGAMVADPGAVRDVSASLAEGLGRLLEQLRERVPGATWSLQLDEPTLPSVRSGRLRDESGLGFYRPIDRDVVTARLRDVIEAVGVETVLHCCAPGFDLESVSDSGASAAAVDVTLPEFVEAKGLDRIGEYLDSGRTLLAGVVDASVEVDPKRRTEVPVARLRRIWSMLGFNEDLIASQTTVTPRCGLAGRAPHEARTAMKTATETAEVLRRALDN
ncbi:hypothetical protein [Haloglycomyces albus]|uniref:hypothetical protein n=1 Tax=Haloglycomyces albus TaxID=526067 RepID=UPI00046D14DD|nr:hypothetical protein [Haloglycomyces albus]